MRFMLIEHFRGDPAAVYRRFRERGRLAPDGLRYVDSWVSADLQRCFQLMECEAEPILRQWMDQWTDLVSFEVTQVISSSDAAAALDGNDTR